MKQIAIDFSRTHFKHRVRLRRFSMLTGALWLIGGLLLGVLVWECWSLKKLENSQRNSIQQLKTRLQVSAQPQKKTEPPLSAAKTEALNSAIQKLNLPWRDLLNAIEQATPKNIALLSLEPDAGKNTLIILAEAANPESMLDYLGQLKAQDWFLEVRLIKHEINKQDIYTPYRFQIEARWREAAP